VKDCGSPIIQPVLKTWVASPEAALSRDWLHDRRPSLWFLSRNQPIAEPKEWKFDQDRHADAKINRGDHVEPETPEREFIMED
jgi:hypothetical protein